MKELLGLALIGISIWCFVVCCIVIICGGRVKDGAAAGAMVVVFIAALSILIEVMDFGYHLIVSP